MTAVLDAAALVVSAAALVAAAAALVATRRPDAALPVLLDLLTAAGLLHLAADPSWHRIAAAAAVVALRHLLTYGLHAAGGTPREDRPRAVPTDPGSRSTRPRSDRQL